VTAVVLLDNGSGKCLRGRYPPQPRPRPRTPLPDLWHRSTCRGLDHRGSPRQDTSPPPGLGTSPLGCHEYHQHVVCGWAKPGQLGVATPQLFGCIAHPLRGHYVRSTRPDCGRHLLSQRLTPAIHVAWLTVVGDAVVFGDAGVVRVVLGAEVTPELTVPLLHPATMTVDMTARMITLPERMERFESIGRPLSHQDTT
jgi:hypothetical protein